MADEGKTGGKQIARLEKGNKTRTARHASVMNEIIDRLNAILNLTVSTNGSGSGKFIFSDANAVLDLSGFLGIPDPPPEDTWVLGSIEGVVQWLNTEECACGIDGGNA